MEGRNSAIATKKTPVTEEITTTTALLGYALATAK